MIPDPHFLDAAAWSFVGFGASVTGGQLRFINASIGSSDTVPHVAAEIGKVYRYRLVVSVAPASPITARVLWGGVEIYNQDGTGTFTGQVTATSATGLVFLASLAGQWFIDDVQVSEMHLREQIRAAVITQLTGLTTTGARVSDAVRGPYEIGVSPSLVVLTPTDTPRYSDGSRMGAPAIERVLEVHVEGYASDAGTLDDIAEEVEAAMYADPTLGGLAVSVGLGVQSVEFDRDGQRIEGGIDLIFEVIYRAAEGAPGSVA